MTRRYALCALLLAPGMAGVAPVEANGPSLEAPEAGKKRPKEPKKDKEDEGRDLAPDAEEAWALGRLLHVPPHYASDGTVRLDYDFSDPAQVADFDVGGFSAEALAGPRWQRHKNPDAKPRFLDLSVGSGGAGLLRHELDLVGRYEVRFDVEVARMTRRSDLVFVVGAVGVRFGGQPVVVSSRGIRAKGRGDKTARDEFTTGRLVAVRVLIEEGRLTAWVNGRQTASAEVGADGDGRVGLYATDINLRLRQLRVTGAVDRGKL